MTETIPEDDESPPFWLRVSKWYVGAVVVLLLILAGFQGYTTWQIHKVVSGHNAELQATNNVVNQIKAKQNEHSQTLDKIADLTQQLAVDKNIIALGTMEGLADYQAICDHISGCVLPYPASK